MAYTITLSDEELAELDGLIHDELADRRHELRRTRNPEFRGQVTHHIRLLDHLLRMVHGARPADCRGRGPAVDAPRHVFPSLYVPTDGEPATH